MPVTNISDIRYKLIGVCALKGEEKQLLKSLWEDRFSEQMAFLAEVEPSDRALVMAQKIFRKINDAGYQNANGFEVVLAVFVDLREALDESFRRELANISAMLSVHLHCSVRCQLYFGFVGMAGLDEGEDVALMRQNVKDLLNENHYTQGIYLVGRPAFGGTPEFRWKAVTFMLDMLRRNANTQRIQTVNHNNGTVGFLRYGEYNEQRLAELQDKESRLTNWLGSNGNLGLSNELTNRLTGIEEDVRKNFVVDANMQPIHPDMIVSGFLNIMRARRNNNDSFNRGRAHTLAALQGTGDGLVEQIQEFFKSQMGDPRQYLLDIFDRVGAGIGFVENRALVQSLLAPQLKAVTDTIPPSLAYNEQGYYGEIRDYLAAKLEYGIYKGKKWFYETLLETFKGFSDVKITRRRSEMQEELNMVQNNMNHVPTKQAFCDQAIGAGGGLDAQFVAVFGASGDLTMKYLVCRKDEDRSWMENNCFIGQQQELRFYIHETTGGLVSRDAAPIKALQVLLFDCTDLRLNELFGM